MVNANRGISIGLRIFGTPCTPKAMHSVSATEAATKAPAASKADFFITSSKLQIFVKFVVLEHYGIEK